MSIPAGIDKCVVLARGLGTRMRRPDACAPLDASQSAAADCGAKAMIPFGRPFLDYVLSAAAEAGLRQVCLVIGPEHQTIRDHYMKEKRPTRTELSFAVQPEPLGTANAVLAAQSFAGEDEFLVLNSDNYYPVEALQQAQALGQAGAVLFDAAALVRNGNIREDRIAAFASCVVDEEGFLVDVVEKTDDAIASPKQQKLVSMNCWRFGRDIIAACRDVPVSSRGEYELPQAVKVAMARGVKFKVSVSQAGVLDLSCRSDVATVAERLKNVKVIL